MQSEKQAAAVRERAYAMLWLRRAAHIGAGLLIVAMAGSAGLLLWLWLQHGQVAVLPKPSGQYAVGRVAYDWTDETRADTLGPDPKAKRELMVWVWYPAAPRAGAIPAAYLPAKWAEARHQNAGLLANLLTQRLSEVRVYAVADADLAPNEPTYPVLMMGPGLGPLATDYTTLAEDLASHGYVVVGVNVTYITSVVVFADGRVARSTSMGNVPNAASPEEGKRILDRLIELWTADERFVLNQMAQLSANDQQGRFTGRLDLRRVGVFGHSFGGATALEVCRVDTRCKAGVNLDGYPHENVVKLGLQQPFMFIWSEPSVSRGRWLATGGAQRQAHHQSDTTGRVSVHDQRRAALQLC